VRKRICDSHDLSMKPSNVLGLLSLIPVFSLLVLGLDPPPSPPVADGRGKVYEAERGTYQSLVLARDSTASSGEYLRMEDKGEVAWGVDVDVAGWYSLAFRYRSPQGEKEEYLVRNDRESALGFGRASSWATLTTQTFLKAGINTVALKKSWGGIDIDCLEVAPATVWPSVAPRKNVFYKEHAADMTMKIDRYGHHVVSVTDEGRPLGFRTTDFPDFEDAIVLTISGQSLSSLREGDHILKINLSDAPSMDVDLAVMRARKPAGLTIIAPDVEHGSAVVFVLPTGKILLVDCGKEWVRDRILIPFLERHHITQIECFIITHYHGDHDSGDRGEKIRTAYKVSRFYDYTSFRTGQSFDLEGTKITILNSYEDGLEENTRSLSFRLEYQGFVYVHGADTYAENQMKILKRFPGAVAADVFYANHHFHGSVDVEYLQAMDPSIILLQAEKAIYARSAYMTKVKEEFLHYPPGRQRRFIEFLPAMEVGTVVVRVDGKDRWTYESCKDSAIVLPYLF